MNGGLQLPCQASLADALHFSQCLRVVNSGDRNIMKHLYLWLGDVLDTMMPLPDAVVLSGEAPEYFKNMADIIADMLVSDIPDAASLKSLTNKAVYADMTSSLPPTKVVMESACHYSLV